MTAELESTDRALDGLLARALRGDLGPDPTQERVSVAFVTSQGVRHTGRSGGYRNHVVSLRVGAAVGSCAVEPGQLEDSTVHECAGRDVAALLEHPEPAARIAALDAYLQHARPHERRADGRVEIPGGSSLAKSLARAESVAQLLGVHSGRTVLVVGVVNSLLAALRRGGARCIPCDLKGGRTEWGEPVRTDALAALPECDAIVASGMTLGNGTFEPLLRHARANGKPLVAFAQTGSGILPHFLEAGLTALSAEPYPFFWLDGGPTVLHQYRARDVERRD